MVSQEQSVKNHSWHSQSKNRRSLCDVLSWNTLPVERRAEAALYVRCGRGRRWDHFYKARLTERLNLESCGVSVLCQPSSVSHFFRLATTSSSFPRLPNRAKKLRRTIAKQHAVAPPAKQPTLPRPLTDVTSDSIPATLLLAANAKPAHRRQYKGERGQAREYEPRMKSVTDHAVPDSFPTPSTLPVGM